MGKLQSKTIASLGFFITILMLFVFLIAWMQAESGNRQNFQSAEKIHKKMVQVASIIKLQSLRGYQIEMYVEEKIDVERVSLYKAIKKANEKITELSQRLISFEKSTVKSNRGVKLSQSMKAFDDSQNRILLLNFLEQQAAKKMLVNLIRPLHIQILSNLQMMLEAGESEVKKSLKNKLSDNQGMYYSVIIMGIVAILLGILNIFMVRTSEKTEDVLLKQGTRIRMLYEITSQPGLSTEEQIREILKLGCQLLEMQIAKVCKLNREENTNSFLNVYAPEGFNVCAGTVMPLDKTFCSIVLDANEPVAINDVSKSIYGKKFSHLAAYTAIKLIVNGEIYGSVDFSSNNARAAEFSESDIDLLTLIGAWVSSTLEQRFAQEDLVIAKNEAEAASRTKSSFLANMSHELRTPLNAIIGYSELIKEEASSNNHLMYDKDLHIVNSSALHLLALIDDILDLSKIESGKMEFYMENFSIAQLVSEVSETVTPLMDMKNNKFEVIVNDNIGVMHSDRLKIKQVMLNLLSNASKFTEDGEVLLKVVLDKTNLDAKGVEKDVLFIVKDTGIGISDEQISKIFHAFSQAEISTTSKYGGTGLGLAISRQICQLLGGDIRAKGALGQGTSFTVTIPLQISSKLN